MRGITPSELFRTRILPATPPIFLLRTSGATIFRTVSGRTMESLSMVTTISAPVLRNPW